jgi:hypothetical protein
MPQLLDQVVWPFGQGIGRFQAGTVGHPQRVVAGRDNRGDAIKELQALPDNGFRPWLGAEQGCHVSWYWPPADHQHPP